MRDGDVRVVVLSSRTEQDTGSFPDHRLAAVQAAVDSERAAHAVAEHALQQAQTKIQNLQTRLAHAELAHSEALAAEGAERENAQRALQEAVAAREAAERQFREIAVRSSPEAGKRTRPKRIAHTTPADKLASVRKAREPQPVKWWLPSYRAKAQKR